MTVRMGELGQLTGVKDRNGREIAIGDMLEFDEKEWGSKCVFVMQYQNGALFHPGSVSDLSQWCRVIGSTWSGSPL